MNLFYGKLTRKRAAGSLLYVGCYERLLHFELLLRQFKDAVFVDLIPDLTEEVGDFARGRCRPAAGGLVCCAGLCPAGSNTRAATRANSAFLNQALFIL